MSKENQDPQDKKQICVEKNSLEPKELNEIIEFSLEKTEKKAKITKEDLEELRQKNMPGNFSRFLSKYPESNTIIKRSEEKTKKIKKRAKRITTLELIDPETSKTERFRLLSEKKVFKGIVPDDLNVLNPQNLEDDDCQTDQATRDKMKNYLIAKIIQALVMVRAKSNSI